MPNRRTFIKSVTAVAAAPLLAGTAAGCGPLAGAGAGMVRTLAMTTLETFGMELATKAADGIPSVLESGIAQLKSLTNARAIVGTYVNTPVQQSYLSATVAALHGPDGEEFVNRWSTDLYSSVIHTPSEGRSLRIPAVVQLGINLMCLRFAGIPSNDQRLFDPRGVALNQSVLYRERSQNSLYACNLISGDEKLTSAATFQATTIGEYQMQITWNPSSNATQECGLTVRKGRDTAGSVPDWPYSEKFSIPYRYIFASADNTDLTI